MKYLKNTFTLLFLLLLLPAFAQQQVNKTSFMAHPESVISDGKWYYITDIGKELNPTAKDGDGVIWKMDMAGNNSSVFAKGLDAPKGTAISKGILYVADVDRVKGFDLATGEKKYDIDLSADQTHLLNDITLKDENTLVVTATDVDKIYVVHLSATPAFDELILKNPVHGPNGIAYDKKHNRLYICSIDFQSKDNGAIGYVDMEAPEKVFTKLLDRGGLYDGIALLDDHTLVASDWVEFVKKGVLLKISLKDKKAATINTEVIGGPADFFLTKEGTAIVPAMMEGNILAYKLR